MRKKLKAVNKLSTNVPREASIKFCKLVGTESDALPPFVQMRALFCYGDPHSNGLETDDVGEIRRQREREDTWTSSLCPTVVLDPLAEDETQEIALRQWLVLASELQRMLGSWRSPIAAEVHFVAALAYYWQHELGAVLGNSREHKVLTAPANSVAFLRTLFASPQRSYHKNTGPPMAGSTLFVAF
jgi:hypothetical protein